MSAASELIPAAPPKKPAKKRARAKRAAAPKVVKPPSEFEGLGKETCCNGCNPTDGCVITRGGSGFCAHPRRSGLQSGDMGRHEIVQRYGRARKMLKIADVERS